MWIEWLGVKSGFYSKLQYTDNNNCQHSQLNIFEITAVSVAN
jgi:hypothetical protein